MFVDSSKHHKLFEQFKAATEAKNAALEAYTAYTKSPIRDPKTEKTLFQNWNNAETVAAALGAKLNAVRSDKG